MEDREETIRELHRKIEELALKHKSIYQEIQSLQNSIFELDLSGRTPKAEVPPVVPPPVVEKPILQTIIEEARAKTHEPPVAQRIPTTTKPAAKKVAAPMEEFIGSNLLNKIGIAVLVIGIGFGAKYSIDHDLINPLTRIILGYLSGVGLIGFAIKLKKDHENFSAVLLSGGLAVFYFITYAAYDFYDLIPQEMAFLLMVVFTAFTVFASLQYNREVIGVIGLVGAYAVPFLLSDGSGRALILFSYIAIINAGILVLAFKKEWKRLYYLAFVLTWLSFGAWFTTSYSEKEHLWLSLGFSTLYFITFYATFLSYKLIRLEPLSKIDLFFMLLDSFVFYSFGYASIEYTESGDQYLGLFTLFTAVVHFAASVIVYRTQTQTRDIFYLVAGMVLVFLTMAVPVQLDGNWVTAIWAMEAALLFWIGRQKGFPVYEYLSYPLIVLAFGSLLEDWQNTYHPLFTYVESEFTALAFLSNVQFLTTAIVTFSFIFIAWQSFRQSGNSPLLQFKIADKYFTGAIFSLSLFVIYLGIYQEIQTLWFQTYAASKVMVTDTEGYAYPLFDESLLRLKNIWLVAYSSIFAMMISLLSGRIKEQTMSIAAAIINAAVIFAAIVIGLYEAGGLRAAYLTDQSNPYYVRGIGYILSRYLVVGLTLPLLYYNFRLFKDQFYSSTIRISERVFFHVVIITYLSSELVHWLDMAAVQDSFKLALSVLWGIYALALIVFGLTKDIKYVRILAIVLFAVTLIKLFAYDMEDMSTIAKTIVMMILGILLLISSFLYNKLRNQATHES